MVSKDLFKKVLAISSASILAVSMPAMTVLANEETSTVTATTGQSVEVESITITDGTSAVSANGGDVTVNGDINTSGTNDSYQDYVGDTHYKADPAVSALAGASVTVKGEINAGKDGTEQTAIEATGSTVTVDTDGGKVVGTKSGISAGSSSITVTGDVVGGEHGVLANGGANISVDGNVTASGMQTDYYVNGQIAGTSTFGTGVTTFAENNVVINGDVYGPTGLDINVGSSPYTNDGKILVTGTIAAQGRGLGVYDNDDATFSTFDEVIAATPDITVYEIDAPTPVSVFFNSIEDQTVKAQISNAVESAINYIIKQDENDAAAYSFILLGDNIKPVSGYDTININEVFKLAATLPDNMIISGGNNVNVTNNGDDTYSLILTNPKGGIYLKAVLKTIPASSSSTSNTSSNENTSQDVVVVEEVVPVYADPNKAPAGAITISNTTASAETNAETAAISGDKPARTVAYSIANITPMQYKASIIENVTAAPAGGALNIETDRVACFDTKMIEAISARSDIDVNVVFTYGGKKLKVTIPAGYDVRSLLDEHGYCGFLRLMAILGASEL